MKNDSMFQETRIEGLWIISKEIHKDSRGETREMMNSNWLKPMIPKVNFNQSLVAVSNRGVIRGIHVAARNNPQYKLITCTSGTILDCVVDLRPESPTFREAFIFELSQEVNSSLFLSPGLGHAYQVTGDSATVLYFLQTQMRFDEEYSINAFDEELAIPWQPIIPIMSKRDENAPNLDKALELFPI